jgi:hypothetical protein
MIFMTSAIYEDGLQSVNQSDTDILWGCAAIARAIGRTERQAFHLCSKGQLPVTKIGGQWVASRRRLLMHLVGENG